MKVCQSIFHSLTVNLLIVVRLNFIFCLDLVEYKFLWDELNHVFILYECKELDMKDKLFHIHIDNFYFLDHALFSSLF